MGKTICFTGHRPAQLGFVKSEPGWNGKMRLIYAYDRASYHDFISQLADLLEIKFSEGYTDFLTGGAQGVDMLAFWAVEEIKRRGLKAKNILCMPFEGQSQRWSKRGVFSQDDFGKIRAAVDEVRTVVPGELDDKQKIQALLTRNHYMVDHADLCIALLNSDKYGRGGTAECCRYCDKKRVPVLYLDAGVEEIDNREKLLLNGIR